MSLNIYQTDFLNYLFISILFPVEIHQEYAVHRHQSVIPLSASFCLLMKIAGYVIEGSVLEIGLITVLHLYDKGFPGFRHAMNIVYVASIDLILSYILFVDIGKIYYPPIFRKQCVQK